MMNEQDSIFIKNSVDPIVTLRNLKYCTILGKNKIMPRIAAEISYTATFSEKNDELKELLNNLGDLQLDPKNKNDLIKELDENNIFYDENF